MKTETSATAPLCKASRFAHLLCGLCLVASAGACDGASLAESGTAADETGTSDEVQLIFRIEVDPNAPRLDNFGQPAELAPGHAAQSPTIHGVGAHYLELIPSAFTPLGTGDIVFETPHTEAGGESAVDFRDMMVAEPGTVFVSVPLSEVTPGEYPHARLAVSYQEYDLDFRAEVNGQDLDFTGRLGSFVESLTYVDTFELDGELVEPKANKAQGYWAFFLPVYGLVEGQVPEGLITVPNPLSDSSPIPSGSCVVTGHFDAPLVITGDEQEDVVVTITLSNNRASSG